mmetsp:Transcript_15017/g.50675  ORF Transcript_15017/g.50675 Transcript_15017/m.50675 type:complete len:230 (-) Transcript_15017:472-1161(-)
MATCAARLPKTTAIPEACPVVIACPKTANESTTESIWRTVLTVAKTRAPNSLMVVKMKSCPTAEQRAMSTTCCAQSGCRARNWGTLTASSVSSSPMAVNVVEKRFTWRIIRNDEGLYSVKRASCQLEVNESKAIYPTMSAYPRSSRATSPAPPPAAPPLAPLILNTSTPPVTASATAQSAAGYALRDTTKAMIITGSILHDFASTCVGKDTYLSASYWHTEETMLDVAQ